jgi:hypothetical protein
MIDTAAQNTVQAESDANTAKHRADAYTRGKPLRFLNPSKNGLGVAVVCICQFAYTAFSG